MTFLKTGSLSIYPYLPDSGIKSSQNIKELRNINCEHLYKDDNQLNTIIFIIVPNYMFGFGLGAQQTVLRLYS